MAEEENVFDEGNVLKSQWVKWGKPGDNIHGTLVRVFETTSQFPGHEGEKGKAYEIKADGGEFHDLDSKKNPIEPAITVKPEEIWNMSGGFMIDNALRNVKVGQKIGVKYVEDKPSKQKGFNDMKIKKVFALKNADGTVKVDQAWLDANQVLPPM